MFSVYLLFLRSYQFVRYRNKKVFSTLVDLLLAQTSWKIDTVRIICAFIRKQALWLPASRINEWQLVRSLFCFFV